MNKFIKAILEVLALWLSVCCVLLVIFTIAIYTWWHLDGKERFLKAQEDSQQIIKDQKKADEEYAQYVSEATEDDLSDATASDEEYASDDLDDENSAYMTYTASNGESITIIASDYNGFKYYYENEYTGAGQTLEEVYAAWKGYR